MSSNVENDFPVNRPNWEGDEAAERLRLAVERGGGYSKVVASSGVSSSALSNYLNGREMKLSNAIRIAAACGVSPQWLVFGGDSLDGGIPIPRNGLASSSDDRMDAPLYDIELSAGPGCVADADRPVGTITVSKSLVPPSVWAARDRIVGVRVRGDSMEPTLTSGDVVGVDTTRAALVSGAIYAIRTGDELLVKRVERRLNGDVVVISDNSRYREQIIDAETARRLWEDGDAPIRIIGKVVWRSGSTG